MSGVPLNNTYEHQMDFTSKEAQASYFISKTAFSHTDFTYVKEDGSIKVPRSRDSLYAVNYIMFRNSDFSSKWFYAFVTKLEYVNPSTTKVHFELDVFQTWQFDFTLKPSFVEREHQNRWNADGTPVVNTIDEGLDYGSEYETVKIYQYIPYTSVFFLVMVCTQRMDVNSSEITPMLNGSPQPLTYYIHPFRMNGTSPTVTLDGTPVNLSPLTDVLKNLYKQTGAVNNVASLYVTEYPGINAGYDGTTLSLSMANFDHVTIQDGTSSMNTLYLKKLEEYQDKTEIWVNKYDGFSSVDESKLLMYPYTVTVLADMKGKVQEIKNEYIQSKDLEITVKGSIGTSNKVSYNVKNYLMNESTMVNAPEVALERGIFNNSPNDVPIITDLLSAYLQGNRNSLNNQVNQIAFSSITGTIGSAFGAIGSALGRNPVGAVSGIGGIGSNMANSYFQLQGLMAKQKDLDVTPPSVTNMGGNTAFDFGNDIKGLYIIKKQITAEYRKKLTDFFKMFGYKCNEVKQPNTKSRQNFNFIRTIGANVTGNVPQEDLVIIKKMFDNGVTLWHTSDVGNYALANGEV